MRIKGQIEGCDIIFEDSKYFIRQADGAFIQIIFGSCAPEYLRKRMEEEYKRQRAALREIKNA
jgi:hypothetical protein